MNAETTELISILKTISQQLLIIQVMAGMFVGSWFCCFLSYPFLMRKEQPK